MNHSRCLFLRRSNSPRLRVAEVQVFFLLLDESCEGMICFESGRLEDKRRGLPSTQGHGVAFCLPMTSGVARKEAGCGAVYTAAISHSSKR